MKRIIALLSLSACPPAPMSSTSATDGPGSTGSSSGDVSTGGTTAEPTTSGTTAAPVPDLPPPCPVGSLGCPCTGGGACDGGLVCEAGLCGEGCQVGSLGCPCTQGGGCDAGLSCNAGECGEGVSPPCVIGDIAMDDCCGDMVLDEFEECDAGHWLNDDGNDCTSSCKLAKCGDGVVHDVKEACDGEEFCSADCTFKTCGDGIRDPWEWCDPVRQGPDCTPICTDARKLVFITSTHYAGDALGGIAGAHTKCQEHANAAGHMGTFWAMLSSSYDDAPESTWDWKSLPHVNALGEFLFTPPAFHTFCDNPWLDEFGAAHSGCAQVLEGTDQWAWFMSSYSGEAPTCDAWSGGSVGSAIDIELCGSIAGGAPCFATAPIVCVEQ